MARKRMIDPTIWADEDFGSLSSGAKIMFIGLFSNADDEGLIRASTAYLKSTIFMYDMVALSIIKDKREEVVKQMKSVFFYEVDGKEYIFLKKWSEYQKQHKDRIIPSLLPHPTDNVGQVTDNVGQVTDNVGVSKYRLDKDKIGRVKRGVSSKLSTSVSYLLNIPIEDVKALQETTNATESQIRNKGRDLSDWCAASGKRRKDYKALLRIAVNRDFPKIEARTELPTYGMRKMPNYEN